MFNDDDYSVITSCIDYFNGVSANELAAKFGMSASNFKNVCNNVFYICQGRRKQGIDTEAMDLDEMGKLSRSLHLNVTSEEYAQKIKPVVDNTCQQLFESANASGVDVTKITPSEFIKIISSQKPNGKISVSSGGGDDDGGGGKKINIPSGGRGRPRNVHDLIDCATGGAACKQFGASMADNVKYFTELISEIGKRMLLIWANLVEKGEIWRTDPDALNKILSLPPDESARMIVDTIIQSVKNAEDINSKYSDLLREIDELRRENEKLKIVTGSYNELFSRFSTSVSSLVHYYDEMLQELFNILNQDQINQLMLLMRVKSMLQSNISAAEETQQGET